MDIQKVLKNANEHETRKSEDTKEEEDIERIFFQESVLNSANGERS
jgi:hypothetical protein